MHRSFSGIPLRDARCEWGVWKESPPCFNGGNDQIIRKSWFFLAVEKMEKVLTLEQEEHGDFMGMYKAPVMLWYWGLRIHCRVSKPKCWTVSEHHKKWRLRSWGVVSAYPSWPCMLCVLLWRGSLRDRMYPSSLSPSWCWQDKAIMLLRLSLQHCHNAVFWWAWPLSVSAIR